MLKRLRSLFRVLSSRRNFEDGMKEELGFHIQQYTAELVAAGVSPEDAARRARMEFGNLNSVKGECREARGLAFFDELIRELAYAARMLRKTPGFTVTALLTLAVCLGANLTIFAALDAILLRPLPFPDAGRLVTLFNTYPKAGVDRDGSSITNYYERRGHISAFSSLSIYRYGTAIVGETGATERTPIMRVSPEFFTTVGRGPMLGRAFTDQETAFQTDSVAILTDGYWRQHYQADPGVIGRQIRVDSVALTVIGVLPPGFRFLSSEAQLYFPLASDPAQRLPLQRHSGGNVIQMIARLKPGIALSVAQSQIDAHNTALEADDPQAKMMADAGFRTLVVPLHADHVAAIRPTLLLMQVGVLGLLLIGIVNLVNLLLIRANGRLKEVAVRQALGASARHLVSEVTVETMLLTVAGGLLGLPLGAAGIRLLALLGADRLPLGAQITFNAQVASIGLAGAALIGLILAVPIAWFSIRRNPANALQSETRGGTASGAAQRLRHGFIVVQIAVALSLLAGSGLLALSVERAMAVPSGFNPNHVLSAQISLPYTNYSDGSARLAFTENLLRRIGSLPGVSSVGVATNIPLSGHSGKSSAAVKGHNPRPGESPRGNYSYAVNGDYFSALGFHLREGRFLTAEDSRRARRVCVVDDDFARYYWPHSSALGQHLFEGSEQRKDSEAFEIVGVVGSVKQAELTDDSAQGAIYYPYAFRQSNDIFLVARATLPPEALASALRRSVREIDPNLPVNDLRSMETRISDSLVARRSPAMLGGIFAAIALLLTITGTYGVLSYSVVQRRREIGVRMALGARPQQIRGQFFLLALRLLASGTLLGVIGACFAGRAMQSVLFHVPPLDLKILVAAVCLMGTASVAACLLPSHRAARISPLEALNSQ